MSPLRPHDRRPNPPDPTSPLKRPEPNDATGSTLTRDQLPAKAQNVWPVEVGDALFLTIEAPDKRRLSILLDADAEPALILNLVHHLSHRKPLAAQAILAHLLQVIGEPHAGTKPQD